MKHKKQVCPEETTTYWLGVDIKKASHPSKEV